MQFTTTNQAAISHGIKVLIYGRSGAGKTWMARTAPNPIILSAEAGLLSLRDVSIPVIQIKNMDDLVNAYNWCAGSPDAAQFSTIYIDSLTEIAEVVLANAKALCKDPRQAYGELIERMSAIVRNFRDLPGKNVVMLAKQEASKDDSGAISAYGPSMPGSKLANNLPYLFDEVFYLGIGKDTEGNTFRFLQTAADYQHEAKDRSGALAATEPPDLSYIFNKILGIQPQPTES